MNMYISGEYVYFWKQYNDYEANKYKMALQI